MFISTCHRLFFVALLCGGGFSAQAIVKCAGIGSVEYTDGDCANARTVAMTDLRKADILKADRAEAARRAAADKAELIRLENARHFNEQQAEKHRSRQMSAMRLRQQRCQELLLRKKWLEEDRREATKRSYKNSSRKSQRLAEKYAMDCGG
jgi:hypothetical protein